MKGPRWTKTVDGREQQNAPAAIPAPRCGCCGDPRGHLSLGRGGTLRCERCRAADRHLAPPTPKPEPFLRGVRNGLIASAAVVVVAAALAAWLLGGSS